MGDEFDEIDTPDISSDIGSDVSEETDFTPAEGLEDTDVEEVEEDVDFTPAEELEDTDVEEVEEDVDFAPAEGLEDMDGEEVEEDVDFTPAEGLEDTAIEDVEEDVVLTPAEGLEDTAIEDVEEDVVLTPAEELEDTDIEDVEEDAALTLTEELDDKDIDLSAEENEESLDDGAPVKVLRMDGKETSIHKHNREEELANLDAGIRNAYQPYSDVASELYDDYKDVADDPDISSRDKIEALQQDREKLEELKSEWEDESADWYEERDRLQREIQEQAEGGVIEDIPESVYEDEAAEDLSGDEYAEEASDVGDDSKLPDGYDDGISGLFEPEGDMDAADDSADNIDIDNVTDSIEDDEWEPQPGDASDVSEPLVDVVPLEETRQTIQTVDLPDGSWERVFDHPERLQAELPFEQGNNEYGKEGTCALANLGTWLEIGGSANKENDIVAYASTHMDMDGDPLCSESGGVYPGNIPTIWKNFGVDAYSDSSKNLEHIAEAVESGHAVSVGVNAGKLYENDNPEEFDLNDSYGDGGANHQIGIVSCVRDGVSGNITHFYINDTGRSLSRDACRRVPIQDLYNAVNVKRGVATISKKPIW